MKKYPIPKNIMTIMEHLYCAGYAPYLVGGCVRDFVMGKTPHDYDITVCASPEDIRRLFLNLGYKTYDVGIKFGTVSVLSEGTAVEITPYRTESDYIDARHPEKVEYVKDIKLDLGRRDFTINALAMNKEGEILDLFGGLSDIDRKVLRCVGKPEERFSEDALRILRAVRFACRLDFEIEEETLLAMYTCREKLSKISAERIQSELREILLCKNSPAVLCTCREVISFIIDGFSASPKLCEPYGDFPYRLFLCIKHLEPSKIERIIESLKLSNAEKKKMLNLAHLLSILGDKRIEFDKQIKYLLCDYPEDTLIDIFTLTDSDTSELLSFIRHGTYKMAQIDISGSDVIDTGLFNLEDTGKVLKEIQKKVADGSLENKKEEIIAYIKNCSKSFSV